MDGLKAAIKAYERAMQKGTSDPGFYIDRIAKEAAPRYLLLSTEERELLEWVEEINQTVKAEYAKFKLAVKEDTTTAEVEADLSGFPRSLIVRKY